MNRIEVENERGKTFLALYGVSTQKEILELFREDCLIHKAIKNDDEGRELSASALFSKYVLGITFLYSLSSIKSNLKLYKKIITELRLGDIVQKKFYFEGLFTTVSKMTEKKVEARKKEGKLLPFDVSDEIKRVKKILESGIYTEDNKGGYKVANNQKEEQVRSYMLTYLLGLSTGRRFTEIMKTVSIQKRGDNYVYSGILKKKDELKNKSLNSYVIELSYREINIYLKELREYLDSKLLKDKNITLEEVTEDEINSIFSRVYNNAVSRISGKKVPNFHELRHIYTIEQQNRYIAQNSHLEDLCDDDLEVVLRNVRYTVLGHEVKSDTTFSYVTIK